MNTNMKDSKNSSGSQSYISDDDEDEDFDMFEDNGEPDSDPGSPFVDIVEDNISEAQTSKTDSNLSKVKKLSKKSNNSRKPKRIA